MRRRSLIGLLAALPFVGVERICALLAQGQSPWSAIPMAPMSVLKLNP